MGSERGFTLTELIIVIVILGIVASISVRFIQFSSRGAIDTAERQQMAMAASIMTERMSRELREALPTSLRERDGGNCIEFIPIGAGGRYVEGDRTQATGSFQTEGQAFQSRITGKVSIYPYVGDAYSPGNPGAVSEQGADWVGDQVQFNGTEDQAFEANSPRRRFYMVGSPVAYCGEGGFLWRYSGHGIGENFRSGTSAVAGAGLTAASFSVDRPSLTRNALVTIELALQADRNGETYSLAQEVQIRNVP
ncbi:MSHA biogenesis protein MshO [Halovibrio salipaludis]|uniref:MSHA biogenesis protein MshO n=1 Tax=Halovibrio salipaludis TaxID=2032626 RepID=A0A2A2EVR8_9GAMM|nr:prepilin-type N-terminal cleavage/methylation domain-containing protein [Halovibrio salipaludis]PAU76373.1 MSHA biogenesis protein MshO [Halovibrio salipaludis]